MMNPLSALKSKASIASSLRNKQMQSSELTKQSENEIYCALCKKMYQFEEYTQHSHKRKTKGNIHSFYQPQGISHRLIEKINVKPAESFIIKYSEDHYEHSTPYQSRLAANKSKMFQSSNSLAIVQPDMKRTSHIREKIQPNPESNEESFRMSMNSSERQIRQTPKFSTLSFPSYSSFNFKAYKFDDNDSEVYQVRTEHRSKPKNMFAQHN